MANFIGPPPGIDWYIGCGITGTTADHVLMQVAWGDGTYSGSIVNGNNANYIPGYPGPYASPASHNYPTPQSYPYTWTGSISCQPYNGSGDMATISFTYTLTYTPNPTTSTGGGGGMGGGHARPI